MGMTDIADFKKILNPAQYDAVTTIDGPVLVVAGAGTGKTRVIEYRCLYMVEKGIAPENILLLTFTRKAARQMLGRVCLGDSRCRKIEGGTFHSFAYRVIKKYKTVLGLGETISFLDESDSADILYLLAGQALFLEEKGRFPKKDTLCKMLSACVNRSQGLEVILARDYSHFLPLSGQIQELAKRYAQYKIERGLIDYDDMLIYLKFLLADARIHEKVSAQFRYIMVDEFQDTNKLQADIVHSLAGKHQQCMAVGDDTQSIYSFRGAYYRNMFDFPKRFPDTKIIKLEYNYRSTQPILDVANAVIEGEKEKYAKVLFTTHPGTELPTLSFFKDSFGEAERVAAKIKEYRDEGISLDSIGVLYRSSFLSLPLQLELSKLNIPFAVYGGLKFIETAHIKDLLAFLKAHHNQKDELALSRVLTLLGGVGPRTAGKIKGLIFSRSENNSIALEEQIKNQQIRGSVQRLIELFRQLEKLESIEEKVKRVIYFYTPLLKEKFDDYPQRQEDLKAFLDLASSYVSLEQLLVDFVTIEPPERSVSTVEAVSKDEPPVVLSTIHSAKGLEWDAVFVIALAEGSLPVSYALGEDSAIEEERRLLYVAVTRARRALHLSMHHEGSQGGVSGFNRLSRFINERRVLEKLAVAADPARDNGFDFDDVSASPVPRQDLYRRMADYLDSNYGEDHF